MTKAHKAAVRTQGGGRKALEHLVFHNGLFLSGSAGGEKIETMHDIAENIRASKICVQEQCLQAYL